MKAFKHLAILATLTGCAAAPDPEPPTIIVVESSGEPAETFSNPAGGTSAGTGGSVESTGGSSSASGGSSTVDDMPEDTPEDPPETLDPLTLLEGSLRLTEGKTSPATFSVEGLEGRTTLKLQTKNEGFADPSMTLKLWVALNVEAEGLIVMNAQSFEVPGTMTDLEVELDQMYGAPASLADATVVTIVGANHTIQNVRVE